jgi:hypothetical protein
VDIVPADRTPPDPDHPERRLNRHHETWPGIAAIVDVVGKRRQPL